MLFIREIYRKKKKQSHTHFARNCSQSAKNQNDLIRPIKTPY